LALRLREGPAAARRGYKALLDKRARASD